MEEKKNGMATEVTNGEKVRAMKDEDLAFILMCHYDTFGTEFDEIPCVKDESTKGVPDEKYCHACVMDWLKKKAEGENNGKTGR